MNRADVVRQRRCRLLILAMLFGILLPVFEWSWITAGLALAGEVVLGVTLWRSCRGFGSDGETPSSG